MESIVRTTLSSRTENSPLAIVANNLNSITDFNLVISVLSTFFLLVKTPMFFLKVFYPPLSVVIHTALLALYSVSAAFQAGSDKSDPDHLQSGPPWYITKNCNVAKFPSNIGYCKQAKSAFACTIVVLCVTHLFSPLSFYLQEWGAGIKST